MSEQSGPVVVTSGQMYALLLSIDARLTTVISKVDGGADTIRDHEARIREIEQREDLSRRVTEIEGSLKSLQQKVWAVPSASVLIAAAALVITFIRLF